MLNKKAIKGYINSKGFRGSSEIFSVLERHIIALLSDACDFTKEDRRKTVKATDTERAIKYQRRKGDYNK